MVTVKGNVAKFMFYHRHAKRVFIAGDFNNWQENQLFMTRDKNGYWSASIKLPPGEFKFRYCADGQWFTDYAAFGVEPGHLGLDSVLYMGVE